MSDKKSNSLELHKELKDALAAYRKKRGFNAEKWVKEKTKLFNDYMSKCGLSACVVSLSGGVDSAVTLALMQYAAGLKDSPIKKTLAIAQPIHSSDWALNRAREAAKALKADLAVIDQTKLHDQLRALVEKEVGVEGKSFATGQLRSYQRTPTGYYVAQLLSQQGTPCVVMGTGNRDEDGYLAYFCKAGDGVVDVQLIADLHKSEVFAVGKLLGVPDSILDAAPSADLWDGQSDEEELGCSYDGVELFTGVYLLLSEEEQKAFKKRLSSDALKNFENIEAVCTATHKRNKHKLDAPHNINILD